MFVKTIHPLPDEYYEMTSDNEDNDGFAIARCGVKLGGFINFAQFPEYPTCPDCKEKMNINFLAMDQCETLLYIWGDCGTGHVTICPKCGKPGLGWACS